LSAGCAGAGHRGLTGRQDMTSRRR
jgi:hypothetical protein